MHVVLLPILGAHPGMVYSHLNRTRAVGEDDFGGGGGGKRNNQAARGCRSSAV